MVCQPQPLGLAEGLGQGQGVLTALDRLGREAQAPQRAGGKGPARDRQRRMTVELLALLRRQVGEGNAVLAVRPGGGIVPQMVVGMPEDVIRRQAVQGSRPCAAPAATAVPPARAPWITPPGSHRTD